jgi:hypothetical protein
MDYPKSVPSAGLVNGKFVDENPLTGMPGSLIPANWGNGVTSEILEVITAAGMTPSESNLTQLLSAIRSISRMTAGLGIQRFIANGSFTVPAGVTKIWLSGCAGGGGGGACPGGTSATASGGGGGGAGQPVIKLMVAVTPGQVIPIVIGAAGIGGSGNLTATAGGNTLVGTSGALLVLSGGSPGLSGVTCLALFRGLQVVRAFQREGMRQIQRPMRRQVMGAWEQADLLVQEAALLVLAQAQGIPGNRPTASVLGAVVPAVITFLVSVPGSPEAREHLAL